MEENICMPCIHTEHEITTILANAAILKPVWLLASAGHMPTAETHCLSTERPFSLFPHLLKVLSAFL